MTSSAGRRAAPVAEGVRFAGQPASSATTNRVVMRQLQGEPTTGRGKGSGGEGEIGGRGDVPGAGGAPAANAGNWRGPGRRVAAHRRGRAPAPTGHPVQHADAPPCRVRVLGRADRGRAAAGVADDRGRAAAPQPWHGWAVGQRRGPGTRIAPAGRAPSGRWQTIQRAAVHRVQTSVRSSGSPSCRIGTSAPQPAWVSTSWRSPVPNWTRSAEPHPRAITFCYMTGNGSCTSTGPFRRGRSLWP